MWSFYNNSPYQSQMLKNMLDKWNVIRFFRATYWLNGNRNVERHHQTIKVLDEILQQERSQRKLVKI